jgi:hypothetical protein
VIVLLVPLYLVVTSYTGAPGPGYLHRYRSADLHALADHINRETSINQCHRPEQVATVDWLRSRVHLSRSFPGPPAGAVATSYANPMLTASQLAMLDDPEADPGGAPPGAAAGC